MNILCKAQRTEKILGMFISYSLNIFTQGLVNRLLGAVRGCESSLSVLTASPLADSRVPIPQPFLATRRSSASVVLLSSVSHYRIQTAVIPH